MSFKVPNQFRRTEGPYGSDDSMGLCGAFDIPHPNQPEVKFFVIASDGMDSTGWEHVSVHGITPRGKFTPQWGQMCFIKDLFWDAEDCVIQFHPPKSEYVNVAKNVLHLWRKVGTNPETPPKILIG